jgi:hypothetical protein
MNTDPSHRDGDDGRVIAFRPLSVGGRPAQQPRPKETVEDLAKYENAGDSDDYRHRMRVNLVAFAVIVVLIGGGIWIADVMAKIRKNDECMMSGRRNCNPITQPAANP